MAKNAVALMIAVLTLTVMGHEGIAGGKPTVQHAIIPVRSGQTFVPSLRLFRTPMAGRVQSLTVHKAAVFPFADYTYQQSFIKPLEWGANRTIVESITDRFLTHGIAVVLQEDVENFLAAEGLIRSTTSTYAGEESPMDRFHQRAMIASTPEFEFSWGLHDTVMRDEILTMVRASNYFHSDTAAMSTSGEPLRQGVTTGVLREQLIEVGRRLDVDVIIRGRILEYGVNLARPNTVVVQLRVYAQDARSAELFWSNRAEVQVSDGGASSGSPPDLRGLFDYASREVVQTLMADFFGER
jgi:hypothetical protein